MKKELDAKQWENISYFLHDLYKKVRDRRIPFDIEAGDPFYSEFHSQINK